MVNIVSVYCFSIVWHLRMLLFSPNFTFVLLAIGRSNSMGIVDCIWSKLTISQEKEKRQWKFFPTSSEKHKGEAKAEYFHGQYCISIISLWWSGDPLSLSLISFQFLEATESAHSTFFWKFYSSLEGVKWILRSKDNLISHLFMSQEWRRIHLDKILNFLL